MSRIFFCCLGSLALFLALPFPTFLRAQSLAPFDFHNGDRVVFLGDTLIERAQYFGFIELALTTHSPDRDLTFRNLGWSGDTPAGDSRFGLSLLQAGHEPADEGWKQLKEQIRQAKPSVVFLGYGMAASFAGEAGLPRFKSDVTRLMDTIEELVIPAKVRFVILSPIPHLPRPAPLPNPEAHNVQLARYAEALSTLAKERGVMFISLFDSLRQAKNAESLSDNGIHPNAAGYEAIARLIEAGLGWPAGKWASNPQAERLRQVIIKKNEWFFYRSRPANMAYIFGFRKAEQGRNAVEIPRFDALIEAEEKKISSLRSLKPVDLYRERLRVYPAPAEITSQPRPSFEVAPGFEVSLWAENPMLRKPIQMNFDPEGRLWVASSEVYPQVEPGQVANDKIIVLEDTTGAGHANKSTVFADGLLIPTGLEPGDGGVYVAQSTELLHLQDSHGHGKADTRHIVLSGFGTEDTHHNLHTLRWGPDGRLYMNQSIYTRTDTETPHGVVRLKSGGVMRLDPRSMKMEILFRGLWNSWGHQFDAFGQSFLTDGAGSSGINYGLPGASYVAYAGARRVLDGISPGSYPKFCSLEIIRTQHFPEDWQGDFVTCDFRANRIVRFHITEQGAGYFAEEAGDLVRSKEVSFRPIDVKLGPDGALYVADWSNPIINHGEVDFRDPRRDREHGRIWRITCKGRPLNARRNLARATNRELLDALTSPNGFERSQAQRVLIERGQTVLSDLKKWQAVQRDESANLAALWLWNAVDRMDENLLRKMLHANDGRIRAAAVRILGDRSKSLSAHVRNLAMTLVVDAHPRVRLEAVRALGTFGTAGAANAALKILDQPMDRFLEYALWLTMNDLADPWLASLTSKNDPVERGDRALAFGLSAVPSEKATEALGKLLVKHRLTREGRGPWIELIGQSGGPNELRRLFDQAARNEFDDKTTLRALTALSDAMRLRKVKPAGDVQGLVALLSRSNEHIRAAALRLAGIWRLESWAQRLAAMATDGACPLICRSACCDSLGALRGSTAVNALKAVAANAADAPTLRRQALLVLASFEPEVALPLVHDAIRKADAVDAEEMWRSLLGIAGLGKRLTDSMRKEPLPRSVATVALRVARESDESHRELVKLLASQAGQPEPKIYSGTELQQIAAQARRRGDPDRGELVYRRSEQRCIACHSIGGAGGKVGPDMTSLGASAPLDYLIESVLMPNRKIKEGYHAIVVLTNDGRVFTGILVRETAVEMVLRDATDKEIAIPLNSIEQRGDAGSLMPAGLLDTLPERDQLDLFCFLGQLGRPGRFDATKSKAARAWQLLAVPDENKPLGAKARQGDPALAWTMIPTTVAGWLPKAEVQTLAKSASKTVFAATRFEAAKAGKIKLQTNVTSNVPVWLDGQPVQLDSETRIAVTRGTHVLVLQVSPATLPDRFRLESSDVVFLGGW